jgi:putative ABC transport system ATP-binding protein
VEGVHYHYGRGALRKQVLFDVHARVGIGEIVILTGPSGSGKTTLLNLIGALREPQQGSLKVLGHELRGAGERQRVRVRRQVGYIFQSHNLLRSLTALSNVAMSLHGQPGLRGAELRARAREALVAVGMEGEIDAYPEQLSGGQRQRVAVARALARRPRLVLADEPTASLDRAAGRAVVDAIHDLARRQGCAVILVTHDNRILDVADRVLPMEDGRLVTLSSEVTSTAGRLLDALARTSRSGELVREVSGLSFAGFAGFLARVTSEFQQLLSTLDASENDALESLLEQVLEAITARAAALLGADRATLFVVDRARGELWSKVAQGHAEIRIPLGSGIAGHVAETGRPRNVADAYADPRFDPEVDRASGYRTGSLLSLPIRNSRGEVFAVMQLLNKEGGRPFDAQDEGNVAEVTSAVSVTLEVWSRMRERERTSPGRASKGRSDTWG